MICSNDGRRRENRRPFKMGRMESARAQERACKLVGEGHTFNSVAVMIGVHYSTIVKWTRHIVAEKNLIARIESEEGSISEHIKNGGDPHYFTPLPCDEPCGEPAGSLKRVEVYRKRVELGQSLWHENDNNKELMVD